MKINVQVNTTPGEREVIGLLADFASRRGLEAHLFGGFVRDVVRGAAPHDVDVKVNTADIQSFGAEFLDFVGEERRVGCYSDPRIVRVRIGPAGGVVDVDLTPRVEPSIEASALSSDFTINSMAMDAREVAAGAASLIDPLRGAQDLAHKTIKMTSPTAFSKDAVRVLRAVRFAQQYGYRIEAATLDAVCLYAPFLRRVHGERLRAEFAKMLQGGAFSRALDLMKGTGVLAALFPEVEAGRGVRQPKAYHAYDVLHHLLAAVGEAEAVLEGRAGFDTAEIKPHLDLVVGDGLTVRDLVPLIAMLHDIGKPSTASLRPDGEPQFLGHDEAGADMVAVVCRRFKFSAAVKTFITSAVRHHMRPFFLSHTGLPSMRAVRRFCIKAGDSAVAVLVLHLADIRAARGPRLNPVEYEERVHFVTYVLAGLREQRERMARPRLITGRDVVAAGIPEGPAVGVILRLLSESQDLGDAHVEVGL